MWQIYLDYLYRKFSADLRRANQTSPNQRTRNQRMQQVLRRVNGSRLPANRKANLHAMADRWRGARAARATRNREANRLVMQARAQAQANAARRRQQNNELRRLNNRLRALKLAQLPSPPRTRVVVRR